jgi:hypothetical protein
MCNLFPTCEPAEIVLHRIAEEIGSVATGLSAVETHVSNLIGAAAAPVKDLEQLQALDRLGQHLRVLEAFLFAAGRCDCGRVDVDAALDSVWLEGVRIRLGGGRTSASMPAEPDLW